MNNKIKILCQMIIGIVIGILIFIFGVRIGVKGAGDIYCEGLKESIGHLNVGEVSTEYTLYGEEFGEFNGVKYVITRTE